MTKVTIWPKLKIRQLMSNDYQKEKEEDPTRNYNLTLYLNFFFFSHISSFWGQLVSAEI